MKFGVNQNIVYKGEVLHVQTEDGGVNNPVITTLLFRGGSVLASRRTSYSDILKSDHLDKIVKEIMREQHKGLLNDLKSGALQLGSAPQAPESQAAERTESHAPTEKTLDQIVEDFLATEKNDPYKLP